MRIKREPEILKVTRIPKSEINFEKRVMWDENKRKNEKRKHELTRMELEDAEHNTNLLEKKLTEGVIGVSEKSPQKVEGGVGYIGEIIEIDDGEKTEIPIWYVKSSLNPSVFYLHVSIEGNWVRYADVKKETIKTFFKGAGTLDLLV